MSIDFDSFFRNHVEGLLIRASWVETLRSMLGLEGVSQIWNGSAAWYLWLRKAPGVYALAFSEGDVFGTNNRRLFEGRFALKCYPYANHPNFIGFSSEERRLVQSDRFDATHTPRFEAAAEIPESLFVVGGISLLCDAKERLVLLTYKSLDALRIHQSSEELVAYGPDCEPAAAHLIRNVAGWVIGYPLFDCLVGLYAHLARRPPAFIGVTRCQGFEYTVYADGKAECRPSRSATQSTLSIGFDLSGGDAERIETLWQDRLASDEEIQIARKLPISIGNPIDLDLPANVTLNPLWWEIAASDFQSELNSTCGCAESHCHHPEKDGPHEH